MLATAASASESSLDEADLELLGAQSRAPVAHSSAEGAQAAEAVDVIEVSSHCPGRDSAGGLEACAAHAASSARRTSCGRRWARCGPASLVQPSVRPAQACAWGG